MTGFFDLFAAYSAEARPGAAGADDWFALSVARSPLHLWAPGDPIEQHGGRILVGVATWSGFDMRLLDVVEEALARHGSDAPRVDVFNMASCRRPGDFHKYIPKLRKVFHPPVAGVWREGDLSWAGEGYKAREQVAHMFGSSSADIVAYVQAWQDKRSTAS